MSTSLRDVNPKDFIRPEDDRPSHGPVYAVNTTNKMIKLTSVKDVAPLSLGVYGSPESIQQIDLKLLDAVPFMTMWATGAIVVSTDSKVAMKYSTMEIDRFNRKNEDEAAVKASIAKTGSDYEIVVSQEPDGRPVTKTVKKG